MENQQSFLESLGPTFNIHQLSDWYSVTHADIIQHGGIAFLSKYCNSFSAALKTIYPSFPWKNFLFKILPRNFWKDSRNHKEYLEWFAEQEGIKTMEDWYKISSGIFKKRKGACLIKYLKDLRTEFSWKFLENSLNFL